MKIQNENPLPEPRHVPPMPPVQPPMPPAPPVVEHLAQMRQALTLKGAGHGQRDVVAAILIHTEALMSIQELLAAMLAIMKDVHEKGQEP